MPWVRRMVAAAPLAVVAIVLSLTGALQPSRVPLTTTRDVAWGTTTHGVEMPVRPLSSNPQLAPVFQLPLGLVARADMGRGSSRQFTRVTFADSSTLNISECPQDVYPAGCGLGDFWRSAIDALSDAGIWPWQHFIKVNTSGQRCRAVTVVGGAYVESYTVGSVPGAPTRVRLNMRRANLAAIRTCHTEQTILHYANGAY